MKIYIKEENQKPIQFIVPNSLFMNRIVANIGAGVVKKNNDIQISSKQIYTLFQALKESKKTFGNYCLVEVESNDGELIRIEL